MTTSNEKPRFIHDCDECTFLGRYEGAGTNYDLYYCGDTVIARYGSEGSCYTSGLPFSYGLSQPLTEARKRAEAAGRNFDADRRAKRDNHLKITLRASRDVAFRMLRDLESLQAKAWLASGESDQDLITLMNESGFTDAEIQFAIGLITACRLAGDDESGD